MTLKQKGLFMRTNYLDTVGVAGSIPVEPTITSLPEPKKAPNLQNKSNQTMPIYSECIAPIRPICRVRGEPGVNGSFA